MILSTVCYIEKDEKYLMLHRTKKKNDINKDKWIGIGGKIEDKESPEEWPYASFLSIKMFGNVYI